VATEHRKDRSEVVTCVISGSLPVREPHRPYAPACFVRLHDLFDPRLADLPDEAGTVAAADVQQFSVSNATRQEHAGVGSPPRGAITGARSNTR
jgi:hypothetical protein